MPCAIEFTRPNKQLFLSAQARIAFSDVFFAFARACFFNDVGRDFGVEKAQNGIRPHPNDGVGADFDLEIGFGFGNDFAVHPAREQHFLIGFDQVEQTLLFARDFVLPLLGEERQDKNRDHDLKHQDDRNDDDENISSFQHKAFGFLLNYFWSRLQFRVTNF